jgi:hypothetical protein
MARKVISSRLPTGVGTTYNFPVITVNVLSYSSKTSYAGEVTANVEINKIKMSNSI